MPEHNGAGRFTEIWLLKSNIKVNAKLQPMAATCCSLLLNLGQGCNSSGAKSGLRKLREVLEFKWRDSGCTFTPF